MTGLIGCVCPDVRDKLELESVSAAYMPAPNLISNRNEGRNNLR